MSTPFEFTSPVALPYKPISYLNRYYSSVDEVYPGGFEKKVEWIDRLFERKNDLHLEKEKKGDLCSEYILKTPSQKTCTFSKEEPIPEIKIEKIPESPDLEKYWEAKKEDTDKFLHDKEDPIRQTEETTKKLTEQNSKKEAQDSDYQQFLEFLQFQKFLKFQEFQQFQQSNKTL